MSTANPLNAVYDACVEDLRFSIGLELRPDGARLPVVQIHYAGWDREMLGAVRAALADGVDLFIRPAANGTTILRFSAREQIAIQLKQDGQTFVLNAPAWDAELTGIAASVAAELDADCHAGGQYQLVLCTPVWSCTIDVHVPSGRTVLGTIEPNTYPSPPA